MNNFVSTGARWIADVGDSRYLAAVRRGFFLLLPVVMIGALSLTLGNLMLPAAWLGGPGKAVQAFFLFLGQASFGFISLFLTTAISYSLAAQRDTEKHHDTQPLVPAIVATISFLVLVMPMDGQISSESFGTRYMFPALLVAIVSTEILLSALARYRSQWRALVGDADPVLPGILHALAPSVFTVAVFVAARAILEYAELNFYGLTSHVLRSMFDAIDSELARALLFVLCVHIAWFFGVHGNNLLFAIEESHLGAKEVLAGVAAGHGAAGTPPEIVSKSLLDAYVLMGGSGVALALALAVMLGWRTGNQGRLARVALFPAAFNISETIVFGLPIVLNPSFVLPFVLAPLAATTVCYYACTWGWIPPAVHTIHWTTPVFFGGYLVSGSWHGVALQAFNLAICVLIYLPFVRVAQRASLDIRQREFQELVKIIDESCLNQTSRLLDRFDTIGVQARQLAAALREAITREQLHLVYQPQVNARGTVVGFEALLRWNFQPFGHIPPSIVIAIAEEAGLVVELGHWVLDKACQRHADWIRAHDAETMHGLIMSVNISPTQLNDPNFARRLFTTLRAHGLTSNQIELEVTETRAVAHNETTTNTLDELARGRIKLAIDDFGMGYSSLLYMRRFQIHAIKLDGSLTREVLSNPSCADIISTVASLCRNKGILIVAEFVEQEEQRNVLHALGCTVFQGALYSMPLPPDECIDFVGRGPHHPCRAALPRAVRTSG